MTDALLVIVLALVLIAPLIAAAMFITAWLRPRERVTWGVAALLVIVAYVSLDGPSLQSLVWQIVVWRMER